MHMGKGQATVSLKMHASGDKPETSQNIKSRAMVTALDTNKCQQSKSLFFSRLIPRLMQLSEDSSKHSPMK